jgi:hypothetical protein
VGVIRAAREHHDSPHRPIGAICGTAPPMRIRATKVIGDRVHELGRDVGGCALAAALELEAESDRQVPCEVTTPNAIMNRLSSGGVLPQTSWVAAAWRSFHARHAASLCAVVREDFNRRERANFTRPDLLDAYSSEIGTVHVRRTQQQIAASHLHGKCAEMDEWWCSTVGTAWRDQCRGNVPSSYS